MIKLKKLSLIFFIFYLFLLLEAIENKILFKVNNEIITSIDILTELKYLKSLMMI